MGLCRFHFQCPFFPDFRVGVRSHAKEKWLAQSLNYHLRVSKIFSLFFTDFTLFALKKYLHCERTYGTIEYKCVE